MGKLRLFSGAAQAMLIAGVAGALVASQAAAQASATSDVTVVGQKYVTPAVVPLTSPYSQSTITRDDVDQIAPSESLQTMLASQPSIFAYENGPNGVGANIYFRAFNSGEFAETFSGVAINDIFNGGVTGQASTFNSVLFIPANVDSVVLTRGINNPAVNSYNSLGGTINFLPRMPSNDFGGEIGASYGSFNSAGIEGSINTGSIDGLRQLAQFDYRSSDGWDKHTEDQNTNLYYAGAYDFPNGNQISLIGVYNHNVGSNAYDIPIPLLQQNGKFFQYPTNEANEHASDDEYMVILEDKALLSSMVTFDNKFFAGGQNFLRTSYANPADSNSPYELPSQAETYDYWIYYPNGPTYNPKKTFGSNPLGNDYHFYGYTTWAIGYTPTLTVELPHNSVVIGGNVSYGELHSREFWYGSADMPHTQGFNDAWDEHDTRTLASVYGQDSIKLFNDTLTITPGVKYEYAKTKDTDDIGFFYPYGGSVSDTESFIAPTIGLNYKPTNQISFNAAFGQNIKFPDISAYYDAVPGTTSTTPLVPAPIKIKPEHVNDYELGVKYQNEGLSASLDVYREDFSDAFIDTFNSETYTTTVTNGGDERFQGVELQVADNFKLGAYGDLRAYLNYAYNQATYTSSFTADSVGSDLSAAGATVSKGERMPDVPTSLASVGGVWNYEGFRFNLEGRYIGGQLTLNENTGLVSTAGLPSYFIVDLGLAKTIPLQSMGTFAKAVTFTLKVNNLFNKYYYNEGYVEANGKYAGPTEFAAPGAPLNVMGKIQISF